MEVMAMFEYLEIETTIINKPPRALFKISCDINNDRVIVTPEPKKNTQVILHQITDNTHIKGTKYISESYPIYLPLDCDKDNGLYKITQPITSPVFDLFTLAFNVCYELGIGKICCKSHDENFIYVFEIDEIQLTASELIKLENYLYDMEYNIETLSLDLKNIILKPMINLENTFKSSKLDCSKINELIECKEEY